MRWLLLLLLSHCRSGLGLRTLPAAPARLLGRAGHTGTAAAPAAAHEGRRARERQPLVRMSGADAHEYAAGLQSDP